MNGPFRFSVRTRVEFADTDAAGVLYYGRYPRYIDQAVIAYRRHIGIDLLGPPGHLYVVRALDLRYHAAAFFDDALEIFARVARIGRTSHTIRVRVERDRDGDRTHLADGEVVVVGLDRYEGRPSAMPGALRDRIREFEGDRLEDVA